MKKTYWMPAMKCPHCDYVAKTMNALRSHANSGKHPRPGGRWYPVKPVVEGSTEQR